MATTRENRNYAKLVGGEPEWGPMPLTVTTHHREESEVDVCDPDTGEPTGGKEVSVREWDTRETKPRPSAEDYRSEGYLPASHEGPGPAPEGFHWVFSGWSDEGGVVHRTYSAVEDPPPAPRRWSSLSIKRALEGRGRWETVKSVLDAAARYDDFMMADYIAVDDDAFKAARRQAVSLYGEEDVAAFLDSLPVTEG